MAEAGTTERTRTEMKVLEKFALRYSILAAWYEELAKREVGVSVTVPRNLELVRAKTIAAYEVIGREVVLYFRSLEPNAARRVPLSLVAAIPGTYTGPASRAYLYYGDEHKTWVPGFKVEVVAR